MFFNDFIRDNCAPLFLTGGNESLIYFPKEQNAADRHCYLLIKAALALLHSV